MLAAFLLFQAAPAAVQPSPPISDAMLEQVVRSRSRLSSKLRNAVLDDPQLRAEIRRAGFEKGCRTVQQSIADVRSRRDAALVAPSVKAMRSVIGEMSLKETGPLSFDGGYLLVRAGRIDQELDRIAGDLLSAAYQDMRETFLRAMRAFPDSQDPKDNIVMPKGDIAAALGIKGAYDLDKPSQLGLACAELLVDPKNRPTISTGPAALQVPPSKDAS